VFLNCQKINNFEHSSAKTSLDDIQNHKARGAVDPHLSEPTRSKSGDVESTTPDSEMLDLARS